MASEAALQREIQTLEAKLKDQRSRKYWCCAKCKRRTQIRHLKIEVVLFYVRPFSCTGGDYWTEGKQPDFYVKCPKCKAEVREYYYEPTRYAFVTEYRYSFGERAERRID